MSFNASSLPLRLAGCIFLALALLVYGIGHARAADQLPGYVIVPISLVDQSNQAVARVKLNDQPASLILDTGASTSLVDSKFYQMLEARAGGTLQSKLPPELQHKTIPINGEKGSVGYIESFKAGSTDLGGGPVAVGDLSGQFGSYNTYHATGKIIGLLGEDILRKYAAIIDWRRRGVYLNTVPAKRLKLGAGLAAAGWTPVHMTTTRAAHFTVPCTVDDKPVRLIVDTGATFTTFDRGAITLKNPMYGRPSRNSMEHLAMYKLPSSMLGMDSNGYLARLENWKVGNYSIARSVVQTNNMPAGITNHETGGEGPIVGLLGAEVLASNNAIVDVGGSTLYLKPSATAKASTR